MITYVTVGSFVEYSWIDPEGTHQTKNIYVGPSYEEAFAAAVRFRADHSGEPVGVVIERWKNAKLLGVHK